jgi:hypothetical protein
MNISYPSLPEVSVEPLGDLILNFLIDRDNESEYLDFKEVIDVSRDGSFAKLAKDIFAFSNYGGGYIIIGFKERNKGQTDTELESAKSKRTFVPKGLPSDFHVDQATLQEKFNSYSNVPIKIDYREFWKNFEGESRKYAAIFVNPSTSVLYPTKKGVYTNLKGKTSNAFDIGTTFIRRGTQSIPASENELQWIEKRSLDTSYKISVLSGEPDQISETLYSNLFELLRLPEFIWILSESELLRLVGTDRKLESLQYIEWKGNAITFTDLSSVNKSISNGPEFQTIRAEETQSWVLEPEKRRLLIQLLNLGLSNQIKDLGLVEEESKRKFYFPSSEEVRKEIWKPRFRNSSQVTVAQRIWIEQIKSFIYWHTAVNAKFTSIRDRVFLQLNPSVQITVDGSKAIFGEKEGAIITRLIHDKYNSAYFNSILFWIQKLSKEQDYLYLNEGRTIVSILPVSADLPIGIRADTPPTQYVLDGTTNDPPHQSSNRRTFRSLFLEEPDLVFGGQREEKDPKIGLRYLGPYQYASEQTPTPGQVKVGIVGTATTIDLIQQIIGKLQQPIETLETNKWLYPDYPGFREDTSIKCELVTSSNWNLIIKESEVRAVLSISDNVNKRIATGVNLFRDKVRIISQEDNRPDVIICALPQDIEEYCGISERTRGAKRPKFTSTEKLIAELKTKGQSFWEEWGLEIEEPKDKSDIDLDFHNALKGKIMEFGIPVQLLRESSARGYLNYGSSAVKRVQEPSTFSYNLATALYYKANGKPWRLAKLRQDTCYVGISFFHNLLNPNLDIQTSMAQVFTHNGEGMVLRGTDVVVDKQSRQPHMSYKQSKELMLRALKTYEERADRPPSRIVIHKMTMFSNDEAEGFSDVIGSKSIDYVSVTTNHGFRFVRTGQYPVLRGTAICLSEDRWLLYTSGYIPRVRTYPGHRIPKPLLITHNGDSLTKEILHEILGLTKLNWNTTSFSTIWPITLEFSSQVGRVLSELPEGSILQNHYRFYM